MLKKVVLLALVGLLGVTARSEAADEKKVRVLIVDGQNNHDWRSTTPIMKKSLEESGRFTVEVATAPSRPSNPQKPKEATPENLEKFAVALEKFKEADKGYRAAMDSFHPDLSKADVVLSNYNGDNWGKAFNADLEARLKEGKVGLVIVHAANNAFGGWKEYNRMIGMGWRDKNYGKRLKLDLEGNTILVPAGEDGSTSHAYTGPFKINVRDSSHPITKGMPLEWLHARDELYDNLRGPIENIHLLATGIAPKGQGTGVHEPMIFTIAYGKGRVFHTPMGHDSGAMRCIGYLTTLGRGTEWAATGAVTLPIPSNFPTDSKESSLPK